MTRPRVSRLALMLPASRLREPWAPDRPMFSEPARSTRCSLPTWSGGVGGSKGYARGDRDMRGKETIFAIVVPCKRTMTQSSLFYMRRPFAHTSNKEDTPLPLSPLENDLP